MADDAKSKVIIVIMEIGTGKIVMEYRATSSNLSPTTRGPEVA